MIGALAPQERWPSSELGSKAQQRCRNGRCRGALRCPRQSSAAQAALDPQQRRRAATHSGVSGPQQQPLPSARCAAVTPPRPYRSHSSRSDISRRLLMTAAVATAAAGANGEATEAAGASGKDLLIVGPGVLGSYVGRLWLDTFPGSTVIGQTNTTASHERLRQLGLQPRKKADADGRKFPFVLFAAPPSGSEDYPAEIAAATRLWDGTGTFLFTGSAGIYAVDDGGQVNEDTAVVRTGVSERNDRLLFGERVALEAGGCVVRLVGLYHALRGAHTFFLRAGSVERWGGYIINLIHYEDAASLCLAILSGDGADGQYYRERVFIGTDGAPVTLQEMMDAVHASGAYEGRASLTGQPGASKGKLVCNAKTRQMLGWQAKYNSFEEFMAAGANDWFRENPEGAMIGAKHA